MRNIVIILTVNLFCLSCIDIIKTADGEFYESVHIEGGGWFKFYESEIIEMQDLNLNDDFTLQIWFSGQEQTDDEAACIASLIGNTSNIAIYRNPNINNIIMIYENGVLIKEFELENMNLSQKNNFYLLSIIRQESEITIYINDNIIMNDDESATLIIENSESLNSVIGANVQSINNAAPENLWYGYIDEIRLWGEALTDTVIKFHNQYPTKLSDAYFDDDDILNAHLPSLNGLWDFRIEISESSIDNVFHDIENQLRYVILYTLESMSNELSELSR